MSKLAVRRLKLTERRFLDEKLADPTLSAYVLDRYRIIEAILHGYSPAEVTRILGCERPTVYQWVYTFNDSGFIQFEKTTNPYGRRIRDSRAQSIFRDSMMITRTPLAGTIHKLKAVRDLLTAFRGLRRACPKRTRLYVIMDHLPLHKTDELATCIAKNRIKPVWIPTYSSWLNLIESHFIAMKKFTLNVSDDPDHATHRRRIYRYLRWRNRRVGSNRFQLAKVFIH